MFALEHRAGRRWALTLAALVFTAVLGGQVGAGQQLAQNAAPQSATGLAMEIEGDPDAGAKVFRKCQACHSLEAGQNRVGPSLFGIVGSEAGTAEGFKYSPVMQGSDVVWTPENLDAFLANPREFMSGTRMVFPGLRDPEDRRDVIAYLNAQSAP